MARSLCSASIAVRHLRFFVGRKPTPSVVRLRSKARVSTMATEEEVGILCYVNQEPGFDAILKHRPDDFLVNEIDTSNTVIHLQNLTAPDEGEAGSTDGSVESVFTRFREIAGEKNCEKLKEMAESSASKEEGAQKITNILLEGIETKSERTAVHLFFKEKHNGLPYLTTDTVKEKTTDAEGKQIEVTKLRIMLKAQARKLSTWDKSRGGNPGGPWSGGNKKYVHFTLYKENVDNQVAIDKMARFLSRTSNSFRIAGTKDKRGVTVQKVSAFKIPPKDLAGLNSKLFNMKLGDFRYANENLFVGQLSGNQFITVLRDIRGSTGESVEKACKALKETGFINYFGLQRFGAGSPTHKVGALLLQGKWSEAARLILKGRENDDTKDQEARKEFLEKWDEESLEKCIANLPWGCVSESKLLKAYKERGLSDHIGALASIPRTIRTMYVHAYQSYLWNHAASTRFQEYGAKDVVVGDLVLSPNLAVSKGEKDDKKSDNAITWETSSTRIREVRVVSQEDVANGVYRIEDVVLPIVGSGPLYPEHKVGKEMFTELAGRDGVSLTDSSHNVQDFSIKTIRGDYRRVFQRVPDLEYEIVCTENRDDKVVETDLDTLRAAGAPGANWPENAKRKAEDKAEGVEQAKRQKTEGEGNGGDAAMADGGGGGGDQEQSSICGRNCLNLVLKFKVGCSVYATMLIRELMKISTAKADHKERSLKE